MDMISKRALKRYIDRMVLAYLDDYLGTPHYFGNSFATFSASLIRVLSNRRETQSVAQSMERILRAISVEETKDGLIRLFRDFESQLNKAMAIAEESDDSRLWWIVHRLSKGFQNFTKRFIKSIVV